MVFNACMVFLPNPLLFQSKGETLDRSLRAKEAIPARFVAKLFFFWQHNYLAGKTDAHNYGCKFLLKEHHFYKICDASKFRCSLFLN